MNLREARERYIKAERAVNRTSEPTQAQWNEFDDAAKALYDAEQHEQDRLDALKLLAATRAAERWEQERREVTEKIHHLAALALGSDERLRRATTVALLLNTMLKERDA